MACLLQSSLTNIICLYSCCILLCNSNDYYVIIHLLENKTYKLKHHYYNYHCYAVALESSVFWHCLPGSCYYEKSVQRPLWDWHLIQVQAGSVCYCCCYSISSHWSVHLKTKECLSKWLHAYKIRSYNHCRWVVSPVMIWRRFTWQHSHYKYAHIRHKTI